LRCLRAIEFFSDLVSNAIAISQVKEIARHDLNQRRCRIHVPKSASRPLGLATGTGLRVHDLGLVKLQSPLPNCIQPRMLQRTLPAGFIAPCLPTKTDKLPSCGQWLHEIKHDGFRIIARKTDAQVRLYSRPGNDLTHRFPLIVETLARLRSRSCIIDGEAVACDDNGVASFNLIRYRRHDDSTFLYAFDLIELNGDDLRHDPLEVRKAALVSVLAKAGSGIRFNEHMEGDGPTVFAHACKMGLEGIVTKRKDSAYRSGRSPDWLKMKNPAAPAVKREAEEDWAKESGK
jgi:bifunctional non-homologous end joining protein LigD